MPNLLEALAAVTCAIIDSAVDQCGSNRKALVLYLKKHIERKLSPVNSEPHAPMSIYVFLFVHIIDWSWDCSMCSPFSNVWPFIACFHCFYNFVLGFAN